MDSAVSGRGPWTALSSFYYNEENESVGKANPWTRTVPRESQKNKNRARWYHKPLDQRHLNGTLNPTQPLGFSDAEGNIFSQLHKLVSEEMFVCLQWKPPDKHRGPPLLRQFISLSLWGSALENKCLLILPGNWLSSPEAWLLWGNWGGVWRREKKAFPFLWVSYSNVNKSGTSTSLN